MRVTKVIVDEQNKFYVVGLEGGLEYTGWRAINEIRTKPGKLIKPGVRAPDELELDIYSRRYLDKLKKQDFRRNTRKR